MLMSNLIDKVKDKLEEYDIPIYEHYPIDDDENVLFVEDMMLVVKEKDSELGVSFQVTSKPELVANNILILKEIPDIKDVNIMESFVFTNDRKIICGEEAFNLVHDAIEQDIIQDVEQKNYYKMLLMGAEGYKC